MSIAIMEVVSAAVIRVDSTGEKRMLLAQRRAEGSHGLAWCTPGGKVEINESLCDALLRELREELCLRSPCILPETDAKWWNGMRAGWSELYLHEGRSVTTGRPFRLRCWTMIDATGLFNDIKVGDGIVGHGWFTGDEVHALRLAPADTANRGALVGALR